MYTFSARAEISRDENLYICNDARMYEVNEGLVAAWVSHVHNNFGFTRTQQV